MGNHEFSFDEFAYTDWFQGSLAFQNTTFNLEKNAEFLQRGGITAGQGSQVTVGKGAHSISTLGFSGGTVDFGALTAGAQMTEGTVNVSKTLDLRGEGVIQVSDSDVVSSVSRDIDSALSLTEVDDGNSTIKLVDAQGAEVLGDAGNLQLQDKNGQILSSSAQRDIQQNGQKAAVGTYDYRLTSGVNNDGLYIGYGLTQLDLHATDSDALVLSSNGKSENAADLSAKITGSGDLAFSSQKGQTVSLSNKDNDYTGVTDLRSGTLLLNNDNVLGNTHELRLAAETELDMNGHSQTVGTLNGSADSLLSLNGGSLTVTNGGTSTGSLTGSGELNIQGGTLDIAGDNSNLTANVNIANSANVLVSHAQGLGSANVENNGTLALNNSAEKRAAASVNYTLGGNLTNNGTLMGANDQSVIDRLNWMRDVQGPMLRDAMKIIGEIDLRLMLAQALHMGDECHNRNNAGTTLLIQALTPGIIQAGYSVEQQREVFEFVASSDYFSGPTWMAMCKAAMDAAHGIEYSTVVTTMARNGVEFGLRVSGLPGQWFTGPAQQVIGPMFAGYKPEDSGLDIGDSAITETYGIGGFAMATAPAIVALVGGTVEEAIDFSRQMREITLGENPNVTIPLLGFMGVPSAIDITRVGSSGILPVINTAIAHKDAGVGMIGAGIVHPPFACFEKAILGWCERYGV